jgi:hypothetical protein
MAFADGSLTVLGSSTSPIIVEPETPGAMFTTVVYIGSVANITMRYAPE